MAIFWCSYLAIFADKTRCSSRFHSCEKVFDYCDWQELIISLQAENITVITVKSVIVQTPRCTLYRKGCKNTYGTKMHERCFITFQPAAFVIKLFTDVMSLSLASLSNLLKSAETRVTLVGFGLKYIDYTQLERLARDKHSSLLQKFVNYYRKSFITLSVLSNSFSLSVRN